METEQSEVNNSRVLALWALNILEEKTVGRDEFYTQWCDLPEVVKLQENIKYTFKNPHLLLEALVHSSFANQFPILELNSYERLEYLGDGLIDAHISIELFSRFTALAEGELSKLRGSIVNEKQFSQLSKLIELNRCLLLGKGEFFGGGGEKPSLLADVFEAFIAAVYLDGGWDKMRKVLAEITDLAQKNGVHLLDTQRLNEFDAKSRFQEEVIKEFRTLPEYRVEEIDNNKYSVGVYVKGVELAAIEHISKKAATKKLAKRVLKENTWRENVRETKKLKREVRNADH